MPHLRAELLACILGWLWWPQRGRAGQTGATESSHSAAWVVGQNQASKSRCAGRRELISKAGRVF